MRTPPSDSSPISKQGTSEKLVLYPQPQPHPLEREKGLMARKTLKIAKDARTLHLQHQHHKDAPTPPPSTTPMQSPTNAQHPTADPKHHPSASTQNLEAS
jgi:hypothetical protein